MPDVEIDIDDLLDADSEEERALKLRVSPFQDLEASGHRCWDPLGLPEHWHQHSGDGSLQSGKPWDAKCSPS